MMLCDCWFCEVEHKPHPDNHLGFEEITSLLLEAESLDPAQSVRLEACLTCGHVQVKR